MLNIRFKVTLPLLLFLLFVLLAWIIRDPGQGRRQQPVKPTPRRPRPTHSSTFEDRVQRRADAYTAQANEDLKDHLTDFVEGKARVRTN